MKRLSISSVAVAASCALAAPAVLAAEYIDLFDATPITRTATYPVVGFAGVDFSQRFVFETAEATVYCGAASTAYVKTDNENGTYGPPIVDNFMTAGDDDVSICLGGTGISQIPGTNCFSSAAGTRPEGGAMELYYGAGSVTAPVDLVAGKNDLEFKLWDFGIDLGNTKLVLELPAACSAEPDSYVKVSGGIGFGLSGRGNSPTETFDGYVYKIGSYVGGELNINFRQSYGYCTYEPGSYGDIEFFTSTPFTPARFAKLVNFVTTPNCPALEPWILGKDASEDIPRGAVFALGVFETPQGPLFYRWVPLETGGAEFFE